MFPELARPHTFRGPPAGTEETLSGNGEEATAGRSSDAIDMLLKERAGR